MASSGGAGVWRAGATHTLFFPLVARQINSGNTASQLWPGSLLPRRRAGRGRGPVALVGARRPALVCRSAVLCVLSAGPRPRRWSGRTRGGRTAVSARRSSGPARPTVGMSARPTVGDRRRRQRSGDALDSQKFTPPPLVPVGLVDQRENRADVGRPRRRAITPAQRRIG